MESDKQTISGDPFWLNDWYVDPSLRRISREGAEVKLEPKVMTVLELLASQPGEVFSRESIEAKAWEGLVVGYDALSTTIIKLRKALGDDSQNPRFIETVSKKGYRLVATVSYQDKPQAGSGSQVGDKQVSVARRAAPIYMGVATVLLLLLTFILFQQDKTSTDNSYAPAEKASLVVLPFTNRNNDAKQDYFSDGITDDLINDLSLYSGLQVIARRSAYIYKERQSDIQSIAHELGVDYVLDGNVRRDKERLRVNVQLVNAKTGANIWVQRFDRQTEDIFDVQDDIRKNILDALSVTLTKEEHKRSQRRYTNSFAAYDLFLQGQASLITRASANDSNKAQQLMEQAIALDPNFARAHAALALIHADAYRFDWTNNPEQTCQEALSIGQRAIELDNRINQAYWILGYVYLFCFEQHDKAIEMGKRATQLAPNDNDGFNVLAVTYAFGDEPEKGRLIIQELMQRNPRYSALVPSTLGLANFRLEKFNEALEAYNISLEINPSRIQGNVYKALTLFRMGNIDDAEFQVDQLYQMHPDFDVDVWAARQPITNKDYVNGMIEDLAKIGVSRH